VATRGSLLEHPTDLLSKGYFACTIGKSRRKAIERYLSSQGEHHGYEERILPPVFVDQYQLSTADAIRISPKHAVVVAQFHLVLSTWGRRGILGSEQGRRIASEWRRLEYDLGIALVKVSFVPDHVHIALRAHPTVSPASIVASLMNAAQDVVQLEMIQAGVERLWALGAYIGSYGDLSSTQIRKYIENWKS
jgi:REP element-mobilizing transposase RayT